MDRRKTLGDRGEAAVAGYLRRRGYRILASQFRCRFGEIDLIARSQEDILCFVEVKTRASGDFARALEAVTAAKQRRLRAAAQFYLMEKQWDGPCRFDVAEVYPGETGGWDQPYINYITSAF